MIKIRINNKDYQLDIHPDEHQVRISNGDDKWITVKPNGEGKKGRHLLVKEGESVKEAIDRTYGKKESKTGKNKTSKKKQTKTPEFDMDAAEKYVDKQGIDITLPELKQAQKENNDVWQLLKQIHEGADKLSFEDGGVGEKDVMEAVEVMRLKANKDPFGRSLKGKDLFGQPQESEKKKKEGKKKETAKKTKKEAEPKDSAPQEPQESVTKVSRKPDWESAKAVGYDFMIDKYELDEDYEPVVKGKQRARVFFPKSKLAANGDIPQWLVDEKKKEIIDQYIAPFLGHPKDPESFFYNNPFDGSDKRNDEITSRSQRSEGSGDAVAIDTKTFKPSMETAKALGFDVKLRDGNRVRTVRTWIPKSQVKNGTIPMWLAKAKVEDFWKVVKSQGLGYGDLDDFTDSFIGELVAAVDLSSEE